MRIHTAEMGRTGASIAKLGGALLALWACGTGWAQQVIDLSPGGAPTAQALTQALNQAVGKREDLRILNMPLDSRQTPTVNLELRSADSVTQQTEFVVVDDTGRQQILKVDTGKRFTGHVQGDPQSPAFVSIAPDGRIRSIIHQGDEAIVSEYQPGSRTTASASLSRAFELNPELHGRDFRCAVEPNRPDLHPLGRPGVGQSSAPQSKGLVTQALTTQRRADIIVDTDFELVQTLGSATATATYISDLFTYTSARYETEIATRFNLVKVLIRSSSADPWNATSANAMLQEVQAYWNDNTGNPDRTLPRHHVHLVSGKNISTSMAYVNSLGNQSWGYGFSAAMRGDFSPQNPQITWDSTVIAHEIGHAFGSGHTHDYDNADGSDLVPSPNTGGAIDCCYSNDNANSQCGLALGGAGRTGFLPGVGSVTGGVDGQRNGTLMSYCHLVSGGMSNIAWSFGTGYTYGSNPGRVAQVMSTQAQANLPVDTASSSFTLTVAKTGSGTVTSNPSGINCGSTCSASYSQGSSVVLTASPGTGYSFTGWSGGACTGVGTCTITMSANTSVTATFTQTGSGVCQARSFSSGEERVLGAYIAYYGRPADTGGLAYWSGRMAQAGGSIWTIIDPFGASEEYTRRFGGLGTHDLVGNLYQQMYGRAPDADGLSFYTNKLDTGASTLASIAINILDGTAGSDASVLANRTAVARHFVTKMEAKGSSAPAISDVTLANLISSVTASSSTADSACQTLTGLIN